MMKAAAPTGRNGLLDGRSRRVNWFVLWRYVATPVPAVLGALVLAQMIFLIDQQVGNLRSARVDNSGWTISQLEVDYLNLLESSVAATAQPADAGALAQVRVMYNILFSRIDLLLEGQDRLLPVRDANNHVVIDDLRQIVHGWGNLIDGPDSELRAALPQIVATLQQYHEGVRATVIASLQDLQRSEDRQRAGLSSVMAYILWAAIVLIVFLTYSALVLVLMINAARRRMQESETVSSQLRSTIEASLDAVVVTDSHCRVTHFNRRAEDAFGYSREEASGQLIGDLRIVDGLGESCVSKMLAEDRPERVEDEPRYLTGLRRDGTPFPIEAIIGVSRAANGQSVFICCLRDISERVNERENLRQARDSAVASAEAKSRFLAVVSHEMRTPLTGVIAALDLLKASDKLTIGDRAYARIARSCSLTALEQVDDLLELTRLNQADLSESPTCYDLAAQLVEIIEQTRPVATSNNNRVVLDASGMLVEHVVAHRRYIARVLINLLSNAMKFTENGEIRVTARLERTGEIAATLKISVADSGIGIPEAMRERIFDNFETGDASYSRATQGAGLGLGIVRKALDRMGGTIWLESEVGKGTTFSFAVPVRLDPESKVERPQAIEAEMGQGDRGARSALRVLLAEDNDVNRVMLRGMLGHCGHEVTEVVNGLDAVRVGAESRFDLILMDISMPVMDGTEAVMQLRKFGASRQSPIIALTAHVVAGEQRALLTSGFDAIEVKPITLARLRMLTDQIRGKPENVSPEDQSATGEVFDASVVLDAKRILGDERFVRLMGQFFAEAETMLARILPQLGNAAGPDPTHALAGDVHKLLGSCSVVGATAMAGVLQELETCLRSTTFVHANLIVLRDRLERAWSLTLRSEAAAGL